MPINHVQTLYQITVSAYVQNDLVLDVARSFLEGYDGAYYFYQHDLDTYCLLYDFQGDWSISNIGCDIAGGCKVYQIDVMSGTHTDIQDSITGTLLGTEEQYFSGTYTHREVSHPIKAESYVYNSAVSVSNSQSYLVFSSENMHPHLIEGVQNYAYAAFWFAIGICIFKLSDRLFRRIY